ncbi:unnamed protein product [Caenorhabditis nigoni]
MFRRPGLSEKLSGMSELVLVDFGSRTPTLRQTASRRRRPLQTSTKSRALEREACLFQPYQLIDGREYDPFSHTLKGHGELLFVQISTDLFSDVTDLLRCSFQKFPSSSKRVLKCAKPLEMLACITNGSAWNPETFYDGLSALPLFDTCDEGSRFGWDGAIRLKVNGLT